MTNAVGARVLYGGHEGYFVADLIPVGNAVVVRASGPVTPGNIIRDNQFGPPTHHMLDFPGPVFWRPDLGVFVVPKKQLRELGKEN
jgi:hypothetical protein